jgi:poly(A) polymerase
MEPGLIDQVPAGRFARSVLTTLRGAGFEALLAGGCVRDLLMNRPPKDFDVATSARPEEVRRLFRRSVPVGESFGVVRVLGPERAEVEVATFRNDGAYVDGRRPESIAFSSPEEDAQRRDFTINGLFLDPTVGRVIDFVGGLKDLELGVIRAIGDPHQRIEEDRLRILRGARFAARFDFRMDPGTEAAIRERAEKLQGVSAERIQQELRAMLTPGWRARALEWMIVLGLDHVALPNWRPDEPVEVSRTLAILGALGESASFPLALAGLHARLQPGRAAKVTAALAAGLKLSNDERQRLGWLVDHQATLERAERQPLDVLKTTLQHPGREELITLRSAIDDTGPSSERDAATVDDRTEADPSAPAASDSTVTASDLGFGKFSGERDGPWCRRMVTAWGQGRIDPAPLLTGADLLELGLKPSPIFRRLIEGARREQLLERLTDREAALAWVQQRLKRLDEAR